MTIILIALQILLVLLLAQLLKRKTVSSALSTFLIFLSGMWYLIPALITVLFQDSVSYRFVVAYDQFVSYAVLETGLLLVTLSSLLLVRQPYFIAFKDNSWAKWTPSAWLALGCLVVAIAISVLIQYLTGTFGETYQELNAFAITNQGTSGFNQSGGIDFVQNLSLCFAYACLLTEWPRDISSRLLSVLIYSWVLMISIYQLLHGSRFGLITPFILLVIYYRQRQWSRQKAAAIIVLTAMLGVFAGGILLLVVGQNRGMYELTPRSTVQHAMQVVDDPRWPSRLGQTLLVELVTKLDSFSTGAILIRYAGAGAVGWEPYRGAAVSVIPRFLYPSKPVPGSADGTYSGHPARLAAAEMGMDPTSGNVQVSPAAVSIWQFGYPGIVGMVIANILQLYLLNSLLLSGSFVMKAVALFAIGIPTFLTLYASPDVVLMSLERILFMYAALWVFFKARTYPARTDAARLPIRPLPNPLNSVRP